MYRGAKVSVFKAFSRKLKPFAFAGAFVLFLWGLWLAFWGSPVDYQQGETVRIMYVHVPSSWFAVGVYAFMGIGAIVGFIWRHPLADMAPKAAAPIGLTLTFISLLTGALWGKPMWGTWWVWDARLTSMLVLFFLYAGYLFLIGSHEDSAQGLKAGRLLLVVGLINLPIIKFSVDWWHTLHQPASVFRSGGAAIHSSLLWPLMVMAGAYACLILGVWLLRMELELFKRKARALSSLQQESWGLSPSSSSPDLAPILGEPPQKSSL